MTDGAIAPRRMSFDEAGRYLGGVSRSTLKKLREHGTLRGYRIGARFFFLRESLDDFIRQQTDQAQL